MVAIAGQTFTGEDDDIQGIHDWLDAYERRTGHSIPMHIDAASGGFVNPFLYPDYAWDFRLPRVKSINTSGHKFGLVYPGLGWIVFRERAVFPEDLVFYVNYLGGEAPTATLNFSKGAATVLMQYYQILRLGRDGYTRIMQHALDNSIHLRDRLLTAGKFDLLNRDAAHPGRRALAQAGREAATTSSTSRTRCASAAGWSRPTPCRPTPRTCGRCASSCARTSTTTA